MVVRMEREKPLVSNEGFKYEQHLFLGRKTEENLLSPRLKTPFKLALSGPSLSGKTSLIFKLLRTPGILDKPTHCIKYYYKIWQPLYDQMKATIPNITFYQGLPEKIDPPHENPCTLIFDDLLLDISKSDLIFGLVTVTSHHANKNVILVTQSLFFNQKRFRDISLNINYFIIFSNPRDRSQITYLGRQIYPHKPNFLPLVYYKATANKPHGFIFLDFCQHTGEAFRLWGQILDSKPLVYNWR